MRMVGKPEEVMMMMMTQKRTTPIADCSLTVRLQAVGDSVTEDEVVCEIETDKVRNSKSFNWNKPACASLKLPEFSALHRPQCRSRPQRLE